MGTIDTEPVVGELRPGFAPIKSEFISKDNERRFDAKLMTVVSDVVSSHTSDDNINAKKPKFRGQNKHRRNQMNNEYKKSERNKINKKYCLRYMSSGECSYGEKCIHSHDLQEFVDNHKLEDITSECYLFNTFGKCPYGICCRFGSKHLNGIQNVINFEKYSENAQQNCVKNWLSKDLQYLLRKKKYDFSIASNAVNEAVKQSDNKCVLKKEMSNIDFSGKLYLAPLTTVGNLPFRRLCKEFGADITCSEMVMATNLLEGNQSEWALIRRHQTEDIFGVQICGANTGAMTRCAQLVSEKCDIDFIDINMGCPIDLVYQRGAGSALMDRKKRLDEIINGITTVSSVPLTLKMRTGVYEGKNIAHKVMFGLKDWSDKIALMTIHGRSREQRYTKDANWDYISECVDASKPIQLFGCGDVLSHEQYYQSLSRGVSGVMIARGALIKPWIFTEIKERRTWDISANERFDILKRFVNYGLENWGSDDEGVAKTRRFLLEWLSFLHRYIPVGLLERLPQRINDRPPTYVGRSDLETLLSSASCNDWLKISELLLGKVPDDFVFYPKHKANAY